MPRRDPLFHLANALSLVRLPLGVLFWPALLSDGGGPVRATVVLVIAGVTDVLDGYVARLAVARQSGAAGPARTTAVTTPAGVGSWLDPICDKLFVGLVLGAIWVATRPSLLLLALIVMRELVQLPLSLVYALVPSLRRWLRYDFRASLLGKAATVLQFFAILALLYRDPSAPVFAATSLAVGLLALGDYIRRAVVMGRARLRQS